MGIAKRTRYMENNPEDIWIVKGKTYNLNLRHYRNYMEYEFIDEKGHFHTVSQKDYSKYFEPVEDVDTRARERDWIERCREAIERLEEENREERDNEKRIASKG